MQEHQKQLTVEAFITNHEQSVYDIIKAKIDATGAPAPAVLSSNTLTRY